MIKIVFYIPYKGESYPAKLNTIDLDKQVPNRSFLNGSLLFAVSMKQWLKTTKNYVCCKKNTL